jgi:hypothetical protein
MAMKKQWNDLTPGARRLIGLLGTFEAILKVVALVDLARRPAAEVRGRKWVWALSIILTNSVGAVPATYLVRGRRPAD